MGMSTGATTHAPQQAAVLVVHEEGTSAGEEEAGSPRIMSPRRRVGGSPSSQACTGCRRACEGWGTGPLSDCQERLRTKPDCEEGVVRNTKSNTRLDEATVAKCNPWPGGRFPALCPRVSRIGPGAGRAVARTGRGGKLESAARCAVHNITPDADSGTVAVQCLNRLGHPNNRTADYLSVESCPDPVISARLGPSWTAQQCSRPRNGSAGITGRRAAGPTCQNRIYNLPLRPLEIR